MEKITINKKDIAGIEVTVDAWIFTLNEPKERPPMFSQQEIQDMHAAKFGGKIED